MKIQVPKSLKKTLLLWLLYKSSVIKGEKLQTVINHYDTCKHNFCFIWAGDQDSKNYQGDISMSQFEGENSQQYYQYPVQFQEEDENSFDPSDFFMHSSLAQEAAANQIKQEESGEGSAPVAMETDINTDLQVSESDSEQETEQPSGSGNDGFDIDEFF